MCIFEYPPTCQKHAPPRLWGALRHVAQYTVLPQKCSKLKIISNHSNTTVNIQLWFGSLKWHAGRKKRRRFIAPPPQSSHLTSGGYRLGSSMLIISQWFLHLEGRGCQAPVSLAPHISLLQSPHRPLHLLIPLSFLPQASLFKFPCCQPTLAKRHSLPVSWLNCWRCLLLLGNPLRSFVPSTETQLHNSLCKREIPSASFPSFSSAFPISLSLTLTQSNRWLSKAGGLLIDSHTLTAGQQWW